MKLEICIDRFASALAAIAGGADRLEVCGALGLDGITPSYGLVEQCVELKKADVMLLIRPHAGDFCYDTADRDTMLRDIRAAQQLGAAGVVLGALDRERRIDRALCQRLIAAARPLSVTFHRAFDLTVDPWEALDCLMELGVDRVLTSGQASSAMQGIPLIRELVRRAGTSLAVMAGGGIRAEQVASLVSATGVSEIHSSASALLPAADAPGDLSLVRATPLTSLDAVQALTVAVKAWCSPRNSNSGD